MRSRGEIHPYAVQTLRDNGLPVTNLNAKMSTDFLEEKAPRIDYAITLCGRPDESVLSSFPTKAKWAFWNISDPQQERGPEHLRRHAFRRAFRELETRIRLFVLVNSPRRTKFAQAA
jgi:arsenate reductase